MEKTSTVLEEVAAVPPPPPSRVLTLLSFSVCSGLYLNAGKMDSYLSVTSPPLESVEQAVGTAAATATSVVAIATVSKAAITAAAAAILS